MNESRAPLSSPDLSSPDLISSPDLTRKEGWRTFVEAPRAETPPKPSLARWKTMSAADRAAFRDQRMIHLNAVAITTPQMKLAHQAMRMLVKSNRYHPSGARPGVAIDSDTANVGKTTIVTHFGRMHEREERKKHPDELNETADEFWPSLYVTLTARTTIKSVCAQILGFFAYPYGSRATLGELTLAVEKVLRRCRTSLIILDDLHFLRLQDKSGQEVNDYLKYLASVIPATFVFAGIELEGSGLLSEGRSRFESKASSQMASRLTLHRIGRFESGTAQGRRTWRNLLGGIEQQLVLMNASDGMLTSDSMARYLFERTHGEIGALMWLVRQGALAAIETSAERLTDELLNGIQLSYAAESPARHPTI